MEDSIAQHEKYMNELFATCLSYDHTLRARIGGNPPTLIEDKIPDDYRFYATLHHPDKEGLMLSILLHNDFDTLLENNIYPNISVKILEHAHGPIGTKNHKSFPNLKMCSISDYTIENESDFLFLKVGGEPRLIQPKSYFYKQLAEHNYSFFLQVEEEGYCEGLDYVFMYGALYLYKHNITNEVIAGFWQYS